MTSCLWLFPSGTAVTTTLWCVQLGLGIALATREREQEGCPSCRVNTSHHPCQGSWCCEEGKEEGRRVGKREGWHRRQDTARQDN